MSMTEIAANWSQVVTGLIGVVMFVAFIGRGAYYNAGKIVSEMAELNHTVSNMRSDIKDICIKQEAIQQQLYKMYPLTHEEARRLLHYHNADGDVCYG